MSALWNLLIHMKMHEGCIQFCILANIVKIVFTYTKAGKEEKFPKILDRQSGWSELRQGLTMFCLNGDRPSRARVHLFKYEAPLPKLGSV